VRRGLTDRVKLVRAEVLGSTTFSLGLLLNGAAATRILDMGPIAGDAAGCEAFRALWGEKAEMRRFKDGTIAESVVWPLARPEDQTLIPGQAAEWLLKKHLGDVGVAHVSSGDEWLSILQVPAAAREAINVAGSEKLGFQPMMTGYDTLYKLLKGVDSELPLAILHVAPASELLRYASPFVPHPIDIARAASAPESLGYIPVAEVTLQFESSPRWPDDLAAIQKLKLALFDKVARVISAHLRGVRVSIAFDADASDIDDSASLEVFLPDGMAFRIRIHHERERTLLERALEPPAPGIPRNLSPPPRKLVQAALARHIKRFKQQPAHHAAMAPMHHRFPSFSTAVRLLKRWAAAHMLSPHISAEALELLTARTYLDSGARAPPSSAAAGFLRTLDFLASWDWAASPAFIPIHAMTRDAASASGRPRFPAEQRATALAAFEKRRTGTEAWVLVTETDEAGTAWTSHVTRVVAARVAALAGASLALAREGEFSVSALFATPLEHYDVVLHLSEGTRAAEALDAAEELSVPSSSFRNLAETRALRPGFDPASLLVSQLQHVYGDSLLAFHDAFGGRTLGLVWNPARNAARAFKPFLGYNSSPADCDAALVEINRDAVVAEIARLGAGIIERVNRRR
jgi:U3 small nucleolar RNA-associated protein 22